MSVPHIPEHRRIVLLTRLVKAASKCDAGRAVVERFAGTIVEGVECFHLWVMAGLLLEYHVTHWEKPSASELQVSVMVMLLSMEGQDKPFRKVFRLWSSSRFAYVRNSQRLISCSV